MSKSIKTGEKFVHNSFFMVRFKTKEEAIPFGHTLDTTYIIQIGVIHQHFY